MIEMILDALRRKQYPHRCSQKGAGVADLYSAIFVEGQTQPTDFEKQLSNELLWLILEIWDAPTGYNGMIDKRESAHKILAKTMAEYRSWLEVPVPKDPGIH